MQKQISQDMQKFTKISLTKTKASCLTKEVVITKLRNWWIFG